MKTVFGSLLIVLAMVPSSVQAQTETFDIATFVRPAGWSSAVSNGILVLQTRATRLGRVEFCQIYLFPSAPSGQSAAANFQSEWNARIVQSLGINAPPAPKTENTPDGWTIVIGSADGILKGVTMRMVLITATGFGKSMSFLINVSPGSYEKEIDKFFHDLNLNAKSQPPPGNAVAEAHPETPGPSQPGTSAAGSLESYVYTVPQNWTRQLASDRIVLTSPMYSNRETCQLTMFPLRSSSRSLGDDALDTFRQLFRADPLSSYPSPSPRLARGISPQGWEYFTLRKLVGGQEGEARTTGVTILLARLETQVATIIGTSKDFLWSQCFGELKGDLWARFFADLQFKPSPPPDRAQQALRQQLVGSWISATATVGLGYDFRADGRYDSSGATRHVSPYSATQDLVTTQNFAFGDGSYFFAGNTIILTRDSDQHRFTHFFRLEQVSKDSGQTWKDELCLLDPAASGEVCYHKQ
jgi:hypothetical protein